MSQTKKVLLTVLVVVVVLFAVLFTIQMIDNTKNTAANKASFEVTMAYNTAGLKNQQLCLRNYFDILNNTQFKLLKDPKAKLSNEYKSAAIYNATINACKASISDIDKVSVPAALPKEKVELAKQLAENKKQMNKAYILKLEGLKKCNGNEACLISKDNLLGANPYEFAQLAAETNIIQFKIAKKNTLADSIFGYFKEVSLKNQLKNIETQQTKYKDTEAKRKKAIEDSKKETKEASKKAPATKTK